MAKKKTNASAPIDPNLTLTQLCKQYCEHMENEGKSPGTRLSYMMELSTAVDELGAETPVASLTAADIERFNNCASVMKLRSGKPKAEPSYMKTRRVIRLALTWAAQTGLIASAPYAAKGEATSDTSEEPAADPAPAKSGKGAKGRKGAKHAEPETGTTSEPAEEAMAAPAA